VRILLVGDLHYDLRQLDWVLAEADRHDLVVIAGDLLDIVATVEVRAQIPVVLRYLQRLAARTTTIVSSGNHDLTGRDEHGERAPLWLPRADAFGVLTDYSSTTIDGALTSVCPWWDGPHGRARVEGFLADQAVLATGFDRWLWVYHWPPPDLPVSWTGSRSYGDADLAGWIDRFRPTLVLTGHVHQAPTAVGGSWIARTGDTWVLNAGRQMGPVPSHITVDLDAWEATWHSYDGSQTQAL
jgi:Icc-related predicted phosphoesterase